jgi:hypothetical protein
MKVKRKKKYKEKKEYYKEAVMQKKHLLSFNGVNYPCQVLSPILSPIRHRYAQLHLSPSEAAADQRVAWRDYRSPLPLAMSTPHLNPHA